MDLHEYHDTVTWDKAVRSCEIQRHKLRYREGKTLRVTCETCQEIHELPKQDLLASVESGLKLKSVIAREVLRPQKPRNRFDRI